MDNIMNQFRNLDAILKITKIFIAVPSLVALSPFSPPLLCSCSFSLRSFGVTFPVPSCSILSVDAMDISGDQHVDVKHDIFKKILDANGNAIEARQDETGALRISYRSQTNGTSSLFSFRTKLWLFLPYKRHYMFLIVLFIGLPSSEIEKPLQRHGGRLGHNETYCGSCYGAEV